MIDWVRFNVPKHYRSYRGRVLQVKWPNQQCQSTEGSSSPKNQASIPPGPSHHVTILHMHAIYSQTQNNTHTTRMWANAQRDGRPDEYRWRPLFNAAKLWLTPTTGVPCSNAAKTRKPLKFAGVPQTRQQISAVSRQFTISGHVEEVSVFNKFFFWLSIHALAAKIQPDKVVQWCQNGVFLRPVFSVSCVQHISDMHSKFELRPHHVWKYGRHSISDRWD